MGYPSAFVNFAKRLSMAKTITITSLRKAVLFVLWNTDRPLKAYDILERLADDQPHATATALYRALGFFVTAGVVHKIDSIQSYALCGKKEAHTCSELFMVCSSCHKVHEVQDVAVRHVMQQLALCHDFHVSDDPIELRGLCARCRAKH
ncbi:MAG: transcriptional repressor [Legionella sp.]|jgi:Fur family zinc uptake transcriptional regulator|nr:transcriptional repressor [Legionella sp.]